MTKLTDGGHTFTHIYSIYSTVTGIGLDFQPYLDNITAFFEEFEEKQNFNLSLLPMY